MDGLTTDRLVYGGLAALLVAEALWPARVEKSPMLRRWCFHAALFAIAAVISVIGFRLARGETGDDPVQPLRIWHMFLVIIALDATAYATHVLAHRVKLLWRFHQLHHADRTLDVSTTFRQHPVQQLWLMPCVLLVAALSDASALEIGIYVALQQLVQAAAHANLRLPQAITSKLAWVFITPELHQTHHSPERRETDSNYGEVFSWWDRLFGTLSPPIANRQVFGLSLPPGTQG